MTADSKIDDGGLAFPGVRAEQVGNLSDYGPTDDDAPTFAEVHHPGMTLRDWFAGQALANPYTAHENSPDKIGEWAYQVADAMIAARKAGA